jgi:hypothetical protein
VTNVCIILCTNATLWVGCSHRIQKKGEWLCGSTCAPSCRVSSHQKTKNQKAKGSASALPFAHTRRFGVSGLVVAGAPYDRQQDEQHQHQSKIVKKITIEQTHSLSLLYRQLPILYEADVSFDWTEAHG